MPRKIRQLKADLLKAGFVWRPGKGSHTFWSHPFVPQLEITLSGHDGDDAQRYQEKQVQDVIRKSRGSR